MPVHAESRFNLGSMDKMFTAVGILQLMEEGLLSLADTVADHLPEYPNGKFAAQVTIEQLRTHTSGLVVDIFSEKFGSDPHRYRANEDYLPLFFDELLDLLTINPPRQGERLSEARLPDRFV